MKYIVETINITRMVHVVEAADEEAALSVARVADDNWQEYLGEVKVDINEYSPERIAYFEKKNFFWSGTSYFDENGLVQYKKD